ncbi:MAG: DNA translocase FtsK 4TM domain-containing protein [Patescibacteria group bacterium]|nr:DNA translocase FtsK 4TM domain-containing protein [Patescibacteria group bacterium]
MSRRRKGFKFPDLSLDPETAHGILTVAVFAIGALIFLSMFDLAGSLGKSLDGALMQIFGWDRIVLPFFFFAIGINRLTPDRFPLRGTNYIGFVVFFLAFNPFIHTVNAVDGQMVPEKIGSWGGRLGSLLSEPFVGLLGRFGATTLFLAIFVISLLLIFNTSLKRAVAILALLLGYLKRLVLAVLAPFKWLVSRKSIQAEERIRQQYAAPEKVQPVVPAAKVSQPTAQDEEDDDADEDEDEVDAKPAKPKRRQPKVEIPLELLIRRDQKPTSGDIQRNQYVIQRTLETFGIPVEMAEVSVGPTVTQFTLKPSEGVKLSRITALHNDLALALAAHPIRIEAPIPGKSLVGLEVPNQSVATVGLREMFESKEWRERRDNIHFVLGRDVSGKPWVTNLGRMPHLLVAGATGSGKSVCLNTLIMSLLYANGPDELKLIMVDPKRVELQVYNGIPHLVTPVITDVEKTVNALKWALREMDRRFDILSKFGSRDIYSYNAAAEEKLPFLVVIVDELADLMVTAMQEVEGPIVRLAQMARAVGIHLVLATQRPSVDVLTGLIKANIPARIAFAVASSTDSRTILDQMGAEKLIGRGDMLYQTAEMASPRRIQGAFVADDEIKRVVEYLKSKYDPAEYDPSVVESYRGNAVFNGGDINSSGADGDALLAEAKEEILRAGKASASLLQRRLKVGYARAARILDLLEEEGFIGPSDGAKPRDILKADFTNQQELPSHPALEQVNREIPDIEEE